MKSNQGDKHMGTKTNLAQTPQGYIPPKRQGIGKIFDSIADTIGNTPLVRIKTLPKEAGCVAEDIVLKLDRKSVV